MIKCFNLAGYKKFLDPSLHVFNGPALASTVFFGFRQTRPLFLQLYFAVVFVAVVAESSTHRVLELSDIFRFPG